MTGAPDGVDVNHRGSDFDPLPWPVDPFDGRRREDDVASVRDGA